MLLSDGAWLGENGPPSIRPTPLPVKQLPTLYVIRRFITACTTVHHPSLSLATFLHPVCLTPVSKLYLRLSRLHFPASLPIKTLYAFLYPSICVICSACLILLQLITQAKFDQLPNLHISHKKALHSDQAFRQPTEPYRLSHRYIATS